MEPRQRWSLLFTVVLITGLWWYHGLRSGGGFVDQHLGTWTDPAGPPGNFLKFELVWKDLPGAPMSVGEGVVTAKHWLGKDAFTGSWNFENYEGDLRLNVTTGKRSYVVPVGFLPDGRIILAFHENNDDAYGPNALRGPAARVLSPIKEAPAEINKPQ